MTIHEQKRLINRLVLSHEDATLVMMFHSMEVMIDKTPYVRNVLMQRAFIKRLENIISYWKIHFEK